MNHPNKANANPSEPTKNNANAENSPTNSPARLFGAMGTASIMGLHMVSGVLVGGGLGYALDRWLGTSPWLSGIFLLLGIGAGFRNVWADARRLMRDESTPKGRS